MEIIIVLIIIMIVSLFSFKSFKLPSHHMRYDTIIENKIQQIIDKKDLKKLNWKALIKAIIWQESAFNHTATGDDGKSLGLMQTKLETARDYFPNRFLDERIFLAVPDLQIYAGISHFYRLYKKYNDLETAIEVYNVGEGAYAKGKRNKKYVNNVMSKYKILSQVETA